MPRHPKDPHALTLELMTSGVVAASNLARSLRVSRATLSRRVKQAGPQIERIGAGRATRYGLRREVGQYGSEWPVYRVTAEGRISPWGRLKALSGAFRFLSEVPYPAWASAYRDADGVSEGMPFFLHDARPQGFIGKGVARQLAGILGVPDDPERWSDDHAMRYFVAQGHDLPGDVIIGDHAMEAAGRLLNGSAETFVSDDARAERYPLLAEAGSRGEVVGSSAGGEQPKFVAVRNSSSGGVRQMLVKYSAPMTAAAGRRWADLLACESIALRLLGRRGIAAAGAELFFAGDRCFLEVERFDRTERGRRGVLSLGVLEDEFLVGTGRSVSLPGDWVDFAGAALQAGLIEADSARTIRWVWCFGTLIGNTDMHRANASFWFEDGPRLRLAPVYDMLPMMYAPNRQGETPAIDFSARPPRAAVADVWPEAAAAAVDFWNEVAGSPFVSEPFRTVAARNRDAVASLAGRYAG